MPKTVTGLAVAVVEIVDPDGKRHAVPVQRGQELPANLADGELDKLTALGAFLSPQEHHESMLIGQPIAQPSEPSPGGVTAAGQLTPVQAHNTAPEGEKVQPASEPDVPQVVAPAAAPVKKSTPRKRAAKKPAAAK